MGEDEPARRSPVVWLVVGAVLALAIVGIVGASALSSIRPESGTDSVPTVTIQAAGETEAAFAATEPGPLPTATAAVASGCPGLSLLGFQQAGSEVSWAINNGLATAISLSRFQFVGPTDNPLVDIRLGGTSLIDPASIGSGNPELVALGGEHTQVPAGTTLPLLLRYTWEDNNASYRIVVTFDSGCTLETTW
jgi:hypothetical protein